MKYKLSFEDDTKFEIIFKFLRNQFYNLYENPDEYFQLPPYKDKNKYIILDTKNEEKIIDYCINQCDKKNLKLKIKPLNEK
jgi:hypothetical protein